MTRVVVVRDIIEINGEYYEQIPEKPRRISKASILVQAAVSMASMYAGSGYNRQRPSVSIPEEYKLILNKKSKLSSV